MKKKILLRGGNLINKGAEAMLLTVVNQIRKKESDLEFYVFPIKEEKGLYEKYGINELKYGTSKSNMIWFFIKNIIYLFPLFVKHKKLNSLNQIFICRDFNGVIDISGFNYGDYWGSSGLLHANIWLEYFNISRDKFYIFMPQAFGSFNKLGFEGLFEPFFRNSTLICARDNASYKYLIEKNENVKPNNLKIFNDIVFSFREKANKSNLKHQSDLIVGIAPNMHIKKKVISDNNTNSYTDLLTKDILALIKKYPNIKIKLVPTETFPDKDTEDDSSLCKEILKKCNTKNVEFDERYLNAEAVFDKIGECDILIGSRFHSLIFALSQGIPVLTIGWSHKYVELMKYFELLTYIIPVDKLGNNYFNTKVEEIIDNKLSLNKNILIKSEKIISENEKLFTIVENIININK